MAQRYTSRYDFLSNHTIKIAVVIILLAFVLVTLIWKPFIGLLLIIFCSLGILAYTVRVSPNKCPSCHRDGRELETKEYIRQIQDEVPSILYQDHYRCKYCKHRWEGELYTQDDAE
ncbi:hypothetical protein C4573_01710 [Candidatus Woesearchaeota archaeon]|nr:MAG: hypothetical protein C4573_01710 [Candidatus Woesearchaeota archaeon]